MKMKKTNVMGPLHLKNDEGVSPVVGVMLMLVVTIIIAAVVASFASGLGSTSDAAPTVSLQVSIPAGTNDAAQNVTIANLGGDSIKTEDLQIIVSYTIPKYYPNGVSSVTAENVGKVIKHTIDGSLEPVAVNDLNTLLAGYPFVPQVTNNDDVVTTRTSNQLFGTAILVPGSSIYFNRDYFLGFDTQGTAIKSYGFGDYAIIHVTIVHIPSGKMIYDQDVVAEW